MDITYAVPGHFIDVWKAGHARAILTHVLKFSALWFALLSLLDLANYLGHTMTYRRLIQAGRDAAELASVNPRTCASELRIALRENVYLTVIAWVILYYYHHSSGFLEQSVILLVLFTMTLFLTYRRTLARLGQIKNSI